MCALIFPHTYYNHFNYKKFQPAVLYVNRHIWSVKPSWGVYDNCVFPLYLPSCGGRWQRLDRRRCSAYLDKYTMQDPGHGRAFLKSPALVYRLSCAIYVLSLPSIGLRYGRSDFHRLPELRQVHLGLSGKIFNESFFRLWQKILILWL